ncbi:thioredoxin family protein, partial [Winogradskyella sp.]|nr:thioredoxin family protein [Winogradskyella sp.]
MALTPSNMLPLGTKAPEFSLIDTKDNKIKSLQDL